MVRPGQNRSRSGPYETNDLWEATLKCAIGAYAALGDQGYTPETIYFLSAGSETDVDGDGLSMWIMLPPTPILNMPSKHELRVRTTCSFTWSGMASPVNLRLANGSGFQLRILTPGAIRLRMRFLIL